MPLPAAALLVAAVAGCSHTAPPSVAPEFPVPAAPRFAWDLPPGFPIPAVPADNAMSAAKVELGRRLFYDRRLSGNGTFACATCHRQALAFTDGRGRSVGSTGQLHPRGSMSLANVAYNSGFDWADPDLRSLEEQALLPMFNETPVELGLAGREAEVLERLASDPDYRERFAEAFPEAQEISLDDVVRALAAFERTLISGNSPYDRLVYGDETGALSATAWRGMKLFFSERLRCSECHGGFNFSGPVATRSEPVVAPTFHNTGLYNVGGRGDYPVGNRGLLEISGAPQDMGRFRAPTLRNIALTAPYMHDGSIATLEGVLEHYARGGRTIGSGPLAGVGRDNPHKSELIAGFELSADERIQLLEFLNSLTDVGFLTDVRLSDPFAGAEKAVLEPFPHADRGPPAGRGGKERADG